MSKNQQERLFELIARKMGGNASLQELSELDALLKQHPDFADFLTGLSTFPLPDHQKETDHTDEIYAAQFVKMMYADKKSSEHPALYAVPSKPRTFKKVWITVSGIAAVLLVFMLLWSSLFSKNKLPHQGVLSVSGAEQRPDSVSKLKLPDGTIVFLNVGSHIEYGSDFDQEQRLVALTGEAYFDVAHNPRKPFLVQTSKATIRVLGTKFNVKNYSDELWEATLLQGKIEMYLNENPKQKLQLEPAQKVSLLPVESISGEGTAQKNKVSISKIKTLDDDVAETSWMSDKLVFVDKPLGQIAKDLERTFGITVHFKSPAVQDFRYTGSFDRDNLPQLLEILDLSKPIKYKLTGKQLVIE